MQEEKDVFGKSGAFSDLSDGEAKAIRLVRMMDPEDKEVEIPHLIIKRLHPDAKPLQRLGPLDVRLYDLESFVNYCVRWGNFEKDVIYYSEVECVLVQDMPAEFGAEGKRNLATLYFTLDLDFAVWAGILNKPMQHKNFVKLLKRNMRFISEPSELIESYQAIETAIGLKRDSDLSDGTKWTVSFQSKTDGKTKPKSLPKSFIVKVPILQDGDADEFSINIEINEPEKPEQEATFELISPEIERANIAAVKKEIVKLREQLPPFLIVHGSM